MNVSIRPLLIPGVAVAVALTPVVVTPTAPTVPAAAAPVVHIPAVALAGFTQDLYDALNGWAQFALQVAQDLFAWNPAISEAISGLYTTLEPIVAAVVRFVDAVVSGPGDLLGTLTTLASNVFGLTNLLPVGAVRSAAAAAPRGPAAAGEAAAAPAAGRATEAAITRGEVAESAPEVVPEVAAEVVADVPAASTGTKLRSSARAEVRAKRQAAAPAAASAAVAATAQQDPEPDAEPVVRSAGKQTRAEAGAGTRAPRSAR